MTSGSASTRLRERLRAVTFDVTGTLIHCPRLGELYAEVLGRHHVEVRAEDVERMFPEVYRELACATPAFVDRFTQHPDGAKGWWGDLVHRLCARLGVAAPTPFAIAELYQRFEHAQAWTVYDDVEPSLERLRGVGLRLGIVANWDERLERLLGELGLRPRFDVVVSSSAIGLAKPHPAIFQHALDRLGVAAEETVHIGDQRIEDFEGARGAGLQALLLRRRSTDDGALAALARQLVDGRPFG
ncbi:MAG TPA: HAD-IA family hydrolase [Thermoanaerobaculia bacterium]|nr:HAD-IA family hydrolase [Thermoanaerobaculia bacterium]